MKTKIIGLILTALLIFSIAVRAQSTCIEARHHYEGHPKPHAYVVTVYSACDERRIVTVKILEAIYGEEVRSEEFPLDPGETHAIRIDYQGDKYFSYAIDHHPAD